MISIVYDYELPEIKENMYDTSKKRHNALSINSNIDMQLPLLNNNPTFTDIRKQ